MPFEMIGLISNDIFSLPNAVKPNPFQTAYIQQAVYLGVGLGRLLPRGPT